MDSFSLVPSIKNISHHTSKNFFLISGPCAIESEDMAMQIAEKLKNITYKLQIPFVFKGSYRKANRSSNHSFTGIGDEKALKILRKVTDTFDLPVTTDIHTDEEAAMAAEYVDILQIPAFLCRQTSLIKAAAETGKVVNIKKGQFMSPESMVHAVQKVRECHNHKVMLTERDCTHSLQQPNQPSGITGGKPGLIATIAKAAIAVGADGLFIETHPVPSMAKSDGANMLPLDQLEGLLTQLVRIRASL